MNDAPEDSSEMLSNFLWPDNQFEDLSFDDWLLSLANLYGGY